MALPFLVGAVAGAVAVIAFNKKDEILKDVKTGIKSANEAAIKAYKKGKKDVKAIVSSGKKVAKKPTKPASKKPAQKIAKAE